MRLGKDGKWRTHSYHVDILELITVFSLINALSMPPVSEHIITMFGYRLNLEIYVINAWPAI